MGQQIIAKLLPLLEKVKWPETAAATEQGRRSYFVGLEKVDAYSGDPNQLTAALKTFATGGSIAVCLCRRSLHSHRCLA